MPKILSMTATNYCWFDGCKASIALTCKPPVQVAISDKAPMPTLDEPDALIQAALFLGWRGRQISEKVSAHFCPAHVANLVCARCLLHDCSCIGGPNYWVK